MATDIVDPTVDSVLKKLAELTVQLEGSQQETLGTLVMAGLSDASDTTEDSSSTRAAAPSEADVSAVAARVHTLRESMTTEEQSFLDSIVAKAMGAEEEVKGHNWWVLTSITAPRGLNFMYSGYCKQMSAAYGGSWASTTLTQYTAHSWSAFSTYTCWGWR